ncbi:hypothetical protein ACWEPL_54300 [Nonomuraea sp. NPDC004186]
MSGRRNEVATLTAVAGVAVVEPPPAPPSPEVAGDCDAGSAVQVIVDGAREMESKAPLTAAAWYRAVLGPYVTP